MIRKASVVGCLVVGGLAALARPVPSTALMERLRAEEDVKALRGFGELRQAFFANELTDSAKPFNLIVLREDLSKGERVEDWSFLVNDEKVLSGKWIGHKCIRILDRPTAARHGVRVVADKGTVSHRLYFVDPELVRLVLSATTESGETDTAKWMTALSSLLIIR